MSASRPHQERERHEREDRDHDGQRARQNSPSRHRTAMWLEEHTEQGVLGSPGFVRSPLVGNKGEGGGGVEVPRAGPTRGGIHPRSGSYGGSMGHGFGMSRQSSPSQWSVSQYSQTSRCMTPSGNVGGGFVGAGVTLHVHSRGMPLPGTAGCGETGGESGGGTSHGQIHISSLQQSPHVPGMSTPPALQITSPVTPRDYSSGYNSPRASEDLQRYTSDEFSVPARQRRSLDGWSGGGLQSPGSGLGGGERAMGIQRRGEIGWSWEGLAANLETQQSSSASCFMPMKISVVRIW